MSIITYVPAAGYDITETGIVNVGGGIAFDVHAALVAGSGVITVDSSVSPQLISVLDKYPGLVRSGSTPGPVSNVDVIAPLVAHTGNNPQVQDILVRGSDGLFAPTQSTFSPQLPPSVGTGSPPSANWLLIEWTLAAAFRLSSATRDSNGAITAASVVWPDGATGTFTTDTASTSFPGAIDAYHVTYVYGAGPTTKTITQTAVTRDSNGAVTAQPALTVA